MTDWTLKAKAALGAYVDGGFGIGATDKNGNACAIDLSDELTLKVIIELLQEAYRRGAGVPIPVGQDAVERQAVPVHGIALGLTSDHQPTIQLQIGPFRLPLLLDAPTMSRLATEAARVSSILQVSLPTRQ